MGTRRTGTILVVDDDHDILDAIAEVLTREGYRVVAASDGAEAIARLAAEPIDLILLDLLMPTMSGWEVIEQRGDAPPPIVVISAAPKDVVPSSSVRVVLQKPFVRGELLATVAAHLRRRD